NLRGRLQDFLRMPRYLHLAPSTDDLPIRTYEISGALHAHIFATVHRLLDPCAECLGDLTVLVRCQRYGEIIFTDELLMLLHRIARDADDLDAGFLVVARKLVEILRLTSAAGCIVLGVEIEDQRL